MKRRDVRWYFFPLIIVGHETFVARARKMDHLDSKVVEERQRLDHGLVDSTRALASPHHQQRRQVFTPAEFLPRNAAVHRLQFLANQRAGYFGSSPGKSRRASL